MWKRVVYGKAKHMCVSSFSSEKKKKTRNGRSVLSFYFIEIFYREKEFSIHFPPLFSIFDNKMFRVGAKTR